MTNPYAPVCGWYSNSQIFLFYEGSNFWGFLLWFVVVVVVLVISTFPMVFKQQWREMKRRSCSKKKFCILMIFHQMKSYKQHNWYLSDEFWVISSKQKNCILVEFSVYIKVVSHYNHLPRMSYTSRFSILQGSRICRPHYLFSSLLLGFFVIVFGSIS